MFETYNTQRHEVMAITSMQAIKLHKAPNEDGRQETQNNRETQGSTGQSLTMGQAERTMKTLLEEGWFEKSQKGYYSLSPRALMELRGWLIGTYNEEDAEEEDSHQKIKTCEACKEIITTVGDQALCVEVCYVLTVNGRANDVRRDLAHSDYMTSAHKVSSEHSRRKNVRGARLTGRARILLESEQPL